MTNIAWKNLVRERIRLAISVGGVAFSVLLILIIRGLYSGITDQATEYIRSVDADLWVAQAGIPGDFFHSTSLVPEDAQAAIQAVDGVQDAVPLLSTTVVFRVRGTGVDLRIMGVDPESGIGGPPAIVEGRGTPGPGQIVVDRVFADNNGLEVGDALNVDGVRLEIVGTARGGNAFVSQFGWAPISDVSGLLGVEDVVNYFLVRTTGADPEAVAARIEREVPGVQAITEEEFADKNTADLREGFLPIIWVLVVIAFAVGIAVIGLTIYTATLEKSREYGVLKAIGFSNRRLYGIGYQQALVSGMAGFAAGTVLSFALAAVLERFIPSFATTIRGGDVALAGGGALAMALLSSFIPVRPVARLDPASVFRV